MKKYNHAYSLCFSLVNENPDGEATQEELIQALKKRIQDLEANDKVCEAVGSPYDSFEEE